MLLVCVHLKEMPNPCEVQFKGEGEEEWAAAAAAEEEEEEEEEATKTNGLTSAPAKSLRHRVA